MRKWIFIIFPCLAIILVTVLLSQQNSTSNHSSQESFSESSSEPESSTSIESSSEEPNNAARIFSRDEIESILLERENGIYRSLTSEQIHEMISHTIELFSTHERVEVMDINYNTHTFYGLPFYASQEYYNCFNKTASALTLDCTFDLRKDIYEAILMQIGILHAEVNAGFTVSGWEIDCTVVISGLDKQLSKKEFDNLSEKIVQVFQEKTGSQSDLKQFECDAFLFMGPNYIGYIQNIATATTMTEVYPDALFPYKSKKYEFSTEEKSAVVEVCDYQTNRVVARIRIAESEHISTIDSLWGQLNSRSESGAVAATPSPDYYFVLYSNGFEDLFGDGTVFEPTTRSIAYYLTDHGMNYALADDGVIRAKQFQMKSDSALGQYIYTVVSEHISLE